MSELGLTESRLRSNKRRRSIPCRVLTDRVAWESAIAATSVSALVYFLAPELPIKENLAAFTLTNFIPVYGMEKASKYFQKTRSYCKALGIR